MPITEEQMQSPLSADLQAILRCLSCGSTLDSDKAEVTCALRASAHIRT